MNVDRVRLTGVAFRCDRCGFHYGSAYQGEDMLEGDVDVMAMLESPDHAKVCDHCVAELEAAGLL